MLYTSILAAVLAAAQVSAVPAGTSPNSLARRGNYSLLNRSGWTITAPTNPYMGNAYARDPMNMLDGNPATLWCSPWTDVNGKLIGHDPLGRDDIDAQFPKEFGQLGPQYITIARPANNCPAVYGLVYKPRDNTATPRGNIGEYEIQYSYNNRDWIPVTHGWWPDNGQDKTVTFRHPIPAGVQYIRLKACSEAGGRGNWACASELNLLGV